MRSAENLEKSEMALFLLFSSRLLVAHQYMRKRRFRTLHRLSCHTAGPQEWLEGVHNQLACVVVAEPPTIMAAGSVFERSCAATGANKRVVSCRVFQLLRGCLLPVLRTTTCNPTGKEGSDWTLDGRPSL